MAETEAGAGAGSGVGAGVRVRTGAERGLKDSIGPYLAHNKYTFPRREKNIPGMQHKII